jgi:hypothetical protein
MIEDVRENQPVEPLVAWEVEINDMSAIVFAATAPKARWLAVKGYREAGYGSRREWPSVKAKRVERYDRSVLRSHEQKCWTPSYVEDMGNV